ncbi:MAG: ROK family protein [Anaerolineales bacterium]|nr:ROK family protein [Anaerolineales bacterium]
MDRRTRVLEKVSDQSFVRSLNKASIVDLIRQAPGGISRAELAESLDVSRTTVSAIVNDLLAEHLVLERGAGPSRGGRRPIVLEINPDAGRVVGVDLGASHLTVLVADLNGHVLVAAEEPLEIAAGPEPCLRATEALVADTLARAGSHWEAVRALGVAVPGPVIAEHGLVSAPPIMPGWDGYPIRAELAARWQRPTSLDNDADLGALGEWTFGAGQGANHLAYIKIGTGIGCGLLLDGRIYRGVLGTAGEIGHVTVAEGGPPCTCGNYGCLEAVAGGRAIAQRADLAVKAGQRTRLVQKAALEPLTTAAVAQAALEGDVVAQQLLADAGRHIGSALASLINLLNPDRIVLGGGVTKAGSYLLEPLQQAIEDHAMRPSRQAVQVVLAQLGRRSVAMGAVAQALAQTFQQAVTRPPG